MIVWYLNSPILLDNLGGNVRTDQHIVLTLSFSVPFSSYFRSPCPVIQTLNFFYLLVNWWLISKWMCVSVELLLLLLLCVVSQVGWWNWTMMITKPFQLEFYWLILLCVFISFKRTPLNFILFKCFKFCKCPNKLIVSIFFSFVLLWSFNLIFSCFGKYTMSFSTIGCKENKTDFYLEKRGREIILIIVLIVENEQKFRGGGKSNLSQSCKNSHNWEKNWSNRENKIHKKLNNCFTKLISIIKSHIEFRSKKKKSSKKKTGRRRKIVSLNTHKINQCSILCGWLTNKTWEDNKKTNNVVYLMFVVVNLFLPRLALDSIRYFSRGSRFEKKKQQNQHKLIKEDVCVSPATVFGDVIREVYETE